MIVYYDRSRIEIEYLSIQCEEQIVIDSFFGGYSDDPNDHWIVKLYSLVLPQEEFSKIGRIPELQHLLYMERNANGQLIFFMHCEPPYVSMRDVESLYSIQDGVKPPCIL